MYPLTDITSSQLGSIWPGGAVQPSSTRARLAAAIVRACSLLASALRAHASVASASCVAPWPPLVVVMGVERRGRRRARTRTTGRCRPEPAWRAWWWMAAIPWAWEWEASCSTASTTRLGAAIVAVAGAAQRASTDTSKQLPGGTIWSYVAFAGFGYTMDVLRLLPTFAAGIGVLGARGAVKSDHTNHRRAGRPGRGLPADPPLQPGRDRASTCSRPSISSRTS